MKAIPRSALSGAFCALAGLAACEMPAPPQDGPAQAAPGSGTGGGAAAAPQDPTLTPAQSAFGVWANSLSAADPMPPMNLSMSLAMSGDLARLDPSVAAAGIEQDMNFAFSMSANGEMADWTRFRLRVDAQMELAALKEQSGGRPMLMGCNVVADGETVWFEPDWSKAWFTQELREQGVGIENMVFSIQVATVRQLLEVLPLVMPEETRPLMESALHCTSSPAAMAQLTARTSQALSFEKRGGRVLAELESLPGLWMIGGEDDPFAQMFQDQPMRWRAEFDAATGVILGMQYEMGMPGGNMSMGYKSQVLGQPFGAEHFRYQLPAGRKVFPVDVFMNPIVMELRRQAGAPADPSNEDFEF